MASRRHLPSDPEFLLEYMENIESDISDDEFDGYIDEEEGVCGGGISNNDREGVCSDVFEEELGSGNDTEGVCSDVFEEHGCGNETEGVCSDVFGEELGCGNDTESVCSDVFEEELGCEEPMEVELPQSTTALTFQSSIPPFTPIPGVTEKMDHLQPVDIFCKLFNDQTMVSVVEETNRYGNQYLQSHSDYLKKHCKARANQLKGKPITMEEMKKFMGLIITMGIVNMPSIQHYWCTSWPFSSSNFSTVMSRDRFLLILKFLHLADNSKAVPKGERGYDILFKIRPLITSLVTSYQRSYTMNREVSVDESIISYKGRLSFLQYMPKKPNKWGMKAWVLAESDTGYTWNFILYTGKQEKRPAGVPLGTHVVTELLKKLHGKGYHVYFDNFYTSPYLCKLLLSTGFGSCGTLRLDRKDVPKSFQKADVALGEVVHYKDGELMGLKWRDKRVVALLTTIHKEGTVTKQRRRKGATGGHQTVQKPLGIDQYNAYMGGVDKSDQLVTYYGYNNFSRKWWKRVYFHLLDVTLVNAYVLYYKTCEGKVLSHMDFRIEVAKGLIGAECFTSLQLAPVVDSPARLIGHNHFPEPSGQHDCEGSHELPTIEDFETVPSPPSSHVTPEAAKSTSHSSQPATTKQLSTPSRSQMELPLRAAKRYVEHYKSERFVWCFVGNKTDQERSVSIDRVQYSCQQLNTSLNFTTCARNGTNVMDALKATVASVHSMWIDNKCCEETRRSAPSVRISSTQQSPPHTSSRCPCPR
ncbi:hypothetical protein EMCRGX_G031300 [Ephydatia muelleri]